MELLPAIDIRDGRCVRLLRGDFEQETRYEIDPLELAQRYRNLGANWLHVVDLDGAASGAPMNLDLIAAIARTEGLNVQLGGGIRSEDDLVRALAVADRVVIGSLAVTAPELIEGWLARLRVTRCSEDNRGSERRRDDPAQAI